MDLSFQREPAVWLSVTASVLGLLVAFNLFNLDADVSASIQAVIVAAFGVWAALKVRPIMPTLFASLATAGAVLLAHFGLEVSDEQLGAVQLVLATLVTLLVRPQQTPVESPRPQAEV